MALPSLAAEYLAGLAEANTLVLHYLPFTKDLIGTLSEGLTRLRTIYDIGLFQRASVFDVVRGGL